MMKEVTIHKLDTDYLYFPTCIFLIAWACQYGMANYINDSELVGEPMTIGGWIFFLVMSLPFLILMGKRFTISETGVTICHLGGLLKKHYHWESFQYVGCGLRVEGHPKKPDNPYDYNFYLKRKKARVKWFWYLLFRSDCVFTCHPSLYLSIQHLTSRMDSKLPFYVNPKPKQVDVELLNKWHIVSRVYTGISLFLSIILMYSELPTIIDLLFAAFIVGFAGYYYSAISEKIDDAQEAEFQRFYEYIQNRDSITNS